MFELPVAILAAFMLLTSMLPMNVGAAVNCSLTQVAFCDTFTQPFPDSRAGTIDANKWSVTRQLAGSDWTSSKLGLCDGLFTQIAPDNDVKVCPQENGEGYFDEAFDDGGTFARLSFRPRQQFDFSNRTGRITFDSDAKTNGGHATWLEVWISDQPAPAVGDGPGVATQPRNGIGLQFSGCGAETPGGGVVGVQYIALMNNWDERLLHYGNDFSASCVKTQDGQRNHFEIRLTENRVEVWGTDFDKSGFRRIAVLDGFNLGFSRGYIQFSHTHYNAEKGGGPADQHYEWANMGFDGPQIAQDRGYDIVDAGSVHLPYSISTARSFNLANVDMTNMTDALLNFTVQSNYGPTDGLQYRFNNGTWRNVPYPFAQQVGDWRSSSTAIDATDLRNGNNTMELRSSKRLDLANIDLTVRISAVSPEPTPTVIPTSSPTVIPTATSTSTPTVIPTSTVTSQPTATVTPTATATPIPQGCMVAITIGQETHFQHFDSFNC